VIALLLLSLITLAFSGTSHAQEKERGFFQSSRALSMGDAYTAYAEGFEGPFYNPAGLALKQELEIKPFDVEVLGSQDFALFGKGALTNLTNLSNLMQEISQNGGKNYSVGLSIVPQMLVKNFSIGVVARGFAEGKVLDNGNLDLYSFADLGAYAQTGLSFGGGIFKIGGGIKIIDRAELINEYTPAEYVDSNLEFGNEWREGLGIGYDVGALLTFPVRFLPRFAVSFQDLGGTKFEDQQLLFKNNKSADGPPGTIRQRVNVGFGFKVKHGRNVRSHFMTELKDVSNAFKSDPYLSAADYIHAGWELNVRDILYLRAGANQGRYWTGGFGLHVGGMGLELASFGENVAFKGNPRVDDRKFVLRYFLKF